MMRREEKRNSNASSNKELKSNRLLWPDVVRIIAIYLVIQIHTTFNTINSYSVLTFYSRLGVLGVPLFVLLSGSLLLGKTEDYKTFFRKRCFKVLVPWIIWTFLYMTYAFTTHHNHVMSDFFNDNKSPFYQSFHFFFRTFMSSLYFLPLIFSIYLLTPILRIIVNHATNFDNLYILTFWFFLFSFIPWLMSGPLFPTWEPTLVYTPIQFSGYFLLGYIVIKQRLLQNIHLSLLFLFSIILLLLILITSNLSFGGYLSPITVLAAVFSFYLIYAAIDKIDAKVHPLVKNSIVLMSGASFGVYLINEMFTDYFSSQLIKISSFLHSELLLAIITYLVLTIIIIVLQKIPIIKYIVPE